MRGAAGGRRRRRSARLGGRQPALDAANEQIDKCRGTRNRASPARLFKLNKDLSDPQKQMISSYDFGGLLSITCETMPTDYSAWIVGSCFDPETSEIVVPGRGRVRVCAEFVHLLFHLPLPSEEPEAVRYELDGEAIHFMHEKFSIEDGVAPKISTIIHWIVAKDGAADEDFMRAWLMVAISTFLCASTSSSISPRCYPSLIDLSALKKKNWCQFVVDQLKESISKTNIGSVKGCVFSLVLMYLESLTGHNLEVPSSTPRVAAWDRSLVDKVIRLDTKRDGSFGNLQIKESEFTVIQSSPFGRLVENFMASSVPPSIPDSQKRKLSEAFTGVFSALENVLNVVAEIASNSQAQQTSTGAGSAPKKRKVSNVFISDDEEEFEDVNPPSPLEVLQASDEEVEDDDDDDESMHSTEGDDGTDVEEEQDHDLDRGGGHDNDVGPAGSQHDDSNGEDADRGPGHDDANDVGLGEGHRHDSVVAGSEKEVPQPISWRTRKKRLQLPNDNVVDLTIPSQDRAAPINEGKVINLASPLSTPVEDPLVRPAPQIIDISSPPNPLPAPKHLAAAVFEKSPPFDIPRRVLESFSPPPFDLKSGSSQSQPLDSEFDGQTEEFFVNIEQEAQRHLAELKLKEPRLPAQDFKTQEASPECSKNVAATSSKLGSGSSSGTPLFRPRPVRLLKKTRFRSSPYDDELKVGKFKCSNEVNNIYNAVCRFSRRPTRSSSQSPAKSQDAHVLDFLVYWATLKDLADSVKPGGHLVNTVAEIAILTLNPFDDVKLSKAKRRVMPLRFTTWLLCGQLDSSGVKTTFQKPGNNLEKCDMVLFPVLQMISAKGLDKEVGHYFLLVLNLRNNQFEVLDSLRSLTDPQLRTCCDSLIEHIKSLWLRFCSKTSKQIQDFGLVEVQVPPQKNIKDCGFHMLTHAEYWNGRNTADFSEKDLPNIRKIWTYKLLSHEKNEANWKTIIGCI